MVHRATILCLTLGLLIVSANPATACDPQQQSAREQALEKSTTGTASAWELGSNFSHLVSLAACNYDSDCNPWLTADETELFFIRAAGMNGPADSTHQGSWDIYLSQWDSLNGAWGPATNLGPNINTSFPERRPTTTATGDTLLFARMGSVYVSIRSGGEYGPAVQAFQASDPALSADAQQIYYVKQNDIWVADRGATIYDWMNHQPVGPPVNTQFNEVRPFPAANDSLLFFSDFGNQRPGGFGGADLWVSTWTGGGWGAPVNVGAPVNTDRPACTPFLSKDGHRLYTSSESFEGSRGEEDLWVAYLDSAPPPADVSAVPGKWTNTGALDSAWNVYDLAVDAAGRLFAATSPGGKIYRSSNGGDTWTATSIPPGAMIAYSLLVASDGTLYVGTYPNGRVFRSSDGGDTWEPTAPLPTATAVRALLETSDGRILAGTSPLCRIFSTTNRGTAWTQLGPTTGISSSITTLFESTDGTLFAGGWGPPNKSTDGGATWSTTILEGVHGMASIETFLETPGDTLWTAGWLHAEGGHVWRSVDAGDSWEQTGEIFVNEVHAVRVYDILQTDGGDLMIGFQPGPDSVACMSADRGLSWQTAGALPGAHEILRFLKLGDGTIYAATTPNGDVYRWTPEAVGVAQPSEQSAPSPGVAAVLGGTPNPFRSGTTITYQVPIGSRVDLSVVDLSGRLVRRLEEAFVPTGWHEARWDGRNESGMSVASGVYFTKLRAGRSVTFQKLVLVR